MIRELFKSRPTPAMALLLVMVTGALLLGGCNGSTEQEKTAFVITRLDSTSDLFGWPGVDYELDYTEKGQLLTCSCADETPERPTQLYKYDADGKLTEMEMTFSISAADQSSSSELVASYSIDQIDYRDDNAVLYAAFTFSGLNKSTSQLSKNSRAVELFPQRLEYFAEYGDQSGPVSKVMTNAVYRESGKNRGEPFTQTTITTYDEAGLVKAKTFQGVFEQDESSHGQYVWNDSYSATYEYSYIESGEVSQYDNLRDNAKGIEKFLSAHKPEGHFKIIKTTYTDTDHRGQPDEGYGILEYDGDGLPCALYAYDYDFEGYKKAWTLTCKPVGYTRLESYWDYDIADIAMRTF